MDIYVVTIFAIKKHLRENKILILILSKILKGKTYKKSSKSLTSSPYPPPPTLRMESSSSVRQDVSPDMYRNFSTLRSNLDLNPQPASARGEGADSTPA